MKRIIVIVIFAFLAATVTVMAQYPGMKENIPVMREWQNSLLIKTNKNILDYYLLLPDFIFECEIPFEQTESARMDAISYKSIKNGFIKGETGEGKFTAVLFKDRLNNRDIIAIVRCGAGCQCFENVYLSLDQGNSLWKDASDVMPSLEEFEKLGAELDEKFGQEVWPLFILPEYGTTITVVDDFSEDQTVLYKLVWANGKFTIEK